MRRNTRSTFFGSIEAGLGIVLLALGTLGSGPCASCTDAVPAQTTTRAVTCDDVEGLRYFTLIDWAPGACPVTVSAGDASVTSNCSLDGFIPDAGEGAIPIPGDAGLLGASGSVCEALGCREGTTACRLRPGSDAGLGCSFELDCDEPARAPICVGG